MFAQNGFSCGETRQPQTVSTLAAGWLSGTLLAHLLFPLPWPWFLLLSPFALLGRFAAGLVLGLSWTLFWVHINFHPLMEEGQIRLLTGEIAAPVEEGRYGWRVIFEGEERLRLYWPRRYPKPEAGQIWRLRARLFPPHGPFNPGGFDRELFDWRRGIDGWGKVIAPPRLLDRRTDLAALREALSERISERLRGAESSGLVQALLLGIRSHISPEQRHILQATGTAHLLAISGLHIGLVAFLFYRLFRPWFRTAILISEIAALGYGALAGFSLPTQRALVMVSIALLALWYRRWFSPWDGLSLALIAVLLFDPRAPLGLSFWLSFSAVFWILYVQGGRSGRWPRFRSLLRIQGALFLGLTPILASRFGLVSPTAPVANLIAVPLVGVLIVPLLFLGLLLLPLGWGVPLQIGSWLLERLIALLDHLAWSVELPSPTPPLWAVASALLGAAILLMPRGLPGRWLGLPFWIPLFMAGGWPDLKEGEVRLTLLDVGHGLAAVVETRNHLLLYDTGPSGKGRWVVDPFLRFLGRAPDLIVVSHQDRDHSGGLRFLRRRFPEVPILSGTPEKLRMALSPPASVQPCWQGKRWLWDGVRFEFLWPPPDFRGGSDNDRSCVLKITSGGRSLLLTGDIGKRVERNLLKRQGPRSTPPPGTAPSSEIGSEVLVAPHHGSRYSSSAVFVRAVRPRHVLFSSGYGGRFPHPQVVKRYRSAGAEIHTTARHGAIIVHLSAIGVEVRHWREEAGHYWNGPFRREGSRP